MAGYSRFSGGGGGVTQHSALGQLDYASAGHTGFATSGSVAAACQTPYRGSTLCVAASDSSAKSKSCADFVCPATDALDYITTTVLPALPTGGGTIILLEGTYKCNTNSKPIAITSSNITIQGTAGATIYDGVNGLSSNFITIATTLTEVTIRDLSFRNRYTPTACTAISSVSASPTNKIQNCSFYNIKTAAISTYAGKVECCNFDTCTSGVIFVNIGGGGVCMCSDCYFTSSPGTFTSQATNIISNCYFYYSTVTALNNAYFVNCSFYCKGVTISGAPGAVTGCVFTGLAGGSAVQYLLTLSGSGITANGNYFYNSETNATYSLIYITGDDNLVYGNILYAKGDTRDVVLTSAAQYNMIYDNKAHHSSTNTYHTCDSESVTNTYWDNTTDVLTIATGYSTNYYVDTGDGKLSTATPFTSALETSYPDVPRNVAIRLYDSASAYVTQLRVSVTGIDNLGETKTEQFHLADFSGGSDARATGNRAFQKITSVIVQSVAPWKPANASISVGLVAAGAKLGISGRATAYTPDFIYTRRNGTDYTAPTFSATYMTLAPSTISVADEFEIQYRKNANYWVV